MGYSAPTYGYSEDIKDMVSRVAACFTFRKRTVRTSSSSSESDSQIDETNSGPSGLCTSLLKKCNMFYNWTMGNMELDEDRIDASNMTLENIKNTVDYHMIVNSSIIDNEFFNAVLPVRPVVLTRTYCREPERHNATARFVSSILKSRKPEDCSVRWLVSFLAKFGYKWLVNTKRLAARDTESRTNLQKMKRYAAQNLAVLASLHTTQGMLGKRGSTRRITTLFPPLHKYCLDPTRCRSSLFVATDECLLPFKGTHASKGLSFDFEDHEATIRDAARDDWHKNSLNKLDDKERDAVRNITSVQLACFSTLMAETRKLPKNEEQAPVLVGRDETRATREDPRIDTFMYQLGYGAGKEYNDFFEELPIEKEFLESFLWNNDPNRLLFQTSAHADNTLALESGDKVDRYLNEHEDSSQFAHSEFQMQFDLEIGRLRSEISQSSENMSLFGGDTCRFIGCIAETVRSRLATWTGQNNHSPEGWRANFAPVGTRFKCSKQLGALFAEMKTLNGAQDPKKFRCFSMRLVWEVQSYLQWKLEKHAAREGEDIRNSPLLIMLFILGFPAIKLEKSPDEEHCTMGINRDSYIPLQERYRVSPAGGPQTHKILLKFEDESRKIVVELQTEGQHEEQYFNWQDWKDAFMGRMCARKHWQRTRLSSRHENLREEARHSRISDPVKCVTSTALGKYYELTYWSGWPPYMPQMAQFELKNLCRYFNNRDGSSPKYGECGPHRYIQFIEFLNTALDIVFEQEVNENLYDEGLRALDEGREEEALRKFVACFAKSGHILALKHAVGLVLKKDPVSETQLFSLRAKMSDLFRVLTSRRDTVVTNNGLNEIAESFGRIYESTGDGAIAVQRALALFHKNGMDGPVFETAIEALESFLISEPGNDWAITFYLALAYQSIFHHDRDPSKREIGAQYMLKVGTHQKAAGQSFAINVGYLLEKGFFVGRDEERIKDLLKIFFELDFWGGEEERRAIFQRLFVKGPDADPDFGIGERPKYAIEVYKKIAEEETETDNPIVSHALNRLGLIYHRGAPGVPENESEAKHWYSKAINLRNIDALCNRTVLNFGQIGDGLDLFELESEFEHRSSSGLNNLAVVYELGRGVNQAAMKAERLYNEAINIDANPIAMYNLAVLYKWGDPQVTTAENRSEAERIISQLISREIDISRLCLLKDQLEKFSILSRNEGESTHSLRSPPIRLEEIGNCLTYVKVLKVADQWRSSNICAHRRIFLPYLGPKLCL